jgi:hypothetical protein
MSVSIIQQKISATDDFDGTLPPGTPVLSEDIKRFPIAATGGLFNFAISSPHIIRSCEINLGGQSAWSVSKKDSEGDEIIIWSGTSEATFFSSDSDRPLLYENETLLLRTTGATGVLKCRIAVERE